MKTRLLGMMALLALATASHAIILYGGDNLANTTAPEGGAPWSAVAEILVGSNVMGSAVYLGNGYMITANHVNAGSVVSFDGTTIFTIEPSTQKPIGGGVDLKIFRLTTSPAIAGVRMLSDDHEIFDGEITLIGWGVGRNATPTDSSVVGWGGAGTSAKRWGLNTLEGSEMRADSGYLYEALVFTLESPSGNPAGVGANEGALTLLDSGSGIFQYIDSQWYLIGINSDVSQLNTSVFGIDGASGSKNYSVRISTYYPEIVAIIPEPASVTLSFIALGALLTPWVVRKTKYRQLRNRA